MATQSTAQLLTGRFQQFQEKQELNKINSDSSIENTVGKLTNNTSIETNAVDDTLPIAITKLITGSDYWVLAKSNRYRKLNTRGTPRKAVRPSENGSDKE